MTWAVAAAMAAVWLAMPAESCHAWRRLHGPAGPRRRTGLLIAAVATVAGVGLVGAYPTVLAEPHLVVVVGVAAGVAWCVALLVRRGRRRDRRDASRRELVDRCDALVAELRSGQPPHWALAWAVRGWSELDHVSSIARLGGDVPAALRHSATRPGAEPLARLAAGWDVAHRSGSGLADLLERMAQTLRDDEEVRREVSASLGPTRATGRLLAALPVFGLGLGVAMGAEPVGVLIGSMFGAWCLAVGVALALLGLWWVDRIVDRAEMEI